MFIPCTACSDLVPTFLVSPSPLEYASSLWSLCTLNKSALPVTSAFVPNYVRSIAAADVEGKSKRIRYYDPPLSRSARALRELQAVPANITLDSLPLSVPGYSGGFTLISLGKIVVGPHENLFWSSPQCLYSHLYPVGSGGG